ncbi:MAG: universal stress protein, partial [Steroidobacteraceae bacterium]|nr:universal stress protein [Steroidobacteraceae bacterium]
RLRTKGLQVDIGAEWDYPAWEALIRQARRSRADLIVAERHAGSHAGAWLMHYTDWELLRQSPLPVYLVGGSGRLSAPRILAAVDPLHAHDKSAELDARIIGLSRQVAAALGGRVELLHAYEPPIPIVGTTIGAVVVAQRQDDSEARARDRLFKLATQHGIAKESCLLAPGPPALVIPSVARQRRCAIVAMGAVSRSGLKRVFIGNTAEQVLARLSTDLLIVKPKTFRDRLPRANRGVRVLLPPPM